EEAGDVLRALRIVEARRELGAALGGGAIAALVARGRAHRRAADAAVALRGAAVGGRHAGLTVRLAGAAADPGAAGLAAAFGEAPARLAVRLAGRAADAAAAHLAAAVGGLGAHRAVRLAGAARLAADRADLVHADAIPSLHAAEGILRADLG